MIYYWEYREKNRGKQNLNSMEVEKKIIPRVLKTNFQHEEKIIYILKKDIPYLLTYPIISNNFQPHFIKRKSDYKKFIKLEELVAMIYICSKMLLVNLHALKKFGKQTNFFFLFVSLKFSILGLQFIFLPQFRDIFYFNNLKF